MDYIIENTKNATLEFLNTLFLKWWKIPPLLALTWGADNLFMIITPGEVEGWMKLAITLAVGGVVIWYTLRKKRQSERHDEEKHRQELAQAAMDKYIGLYERALERKTIPDTTTLADYIKQLKKINLA